MAAGIGEELTSDEKLIVQWWQLFLNHLRERKDLAYVWDDESKEEILQIKSHAQKIIKILERLITHYSKNKEKYEVSIHNLELLCRHLKKVEPSRAWIKMIHDELLSAIDSIEKARIMRAGRRSFLGKIAGLFIAAKSKDAIATQSAKKPIQPRMLAVIQSRLSPQNNRRAHRTRTSFIILHTTEAGDRSSINSVHKSGTANYVVATDGIIYNTIEHTRISKHAGRSMWNNVSNISNISVGIEVVGYHNKPITEKQYSALRTLISSLKSIYRLGDDQVLTHSMVAYGTPNRYHRRSHRGRKRCGMQFANPQVRQKLGLDSKPIRDPDVIAGRLAVADPFLERILYGTAQVPRSDTQSEEDLESNIVSPTRTPWYIARDKYDSPDTKYTFPDGNIMYGDQIEDKKLWSSIPNGTKVEIDAERGPFAGIPAPGQDQPEDEPEKFEGFRELKEGDTAQSIAGDEYNRFTTIYFLRDGRVRTGAQINPSSFRVLIRPGVKVLVGYIYAGEVTASRLPRQIAGVAWNHPSTFYRSKDGTIKSGDEIDDNKIPAGTLVFFRR